MSPCLNWAIIHFGAGGGWGGIQVVCCGVWGEGGAGGDGVVGESRVQARLPSVSQGCCDFSIILTLDSL